MNIGGRGRVDVTGSVDVFGRGVSPRFVPVPGWRRLVESCPSGVVVLGADHVVRYCNSAFASMVGTTVDGVRGRHGWAFFHETSPPPNPAALMDVVTGRSRSMSAQRVLRTASGDPLPVKLEFTLLRSWRGRRHHFLCVVTDVREQAELAGEARRVHERVERFWEQSAVGVVEVARDRRVLSVNEQCARMLGYRPEELVGRDVVTLYAPGQADAVREALDSASQGASYTVERTYLAKDGRHVPALLRVTVLHDDAGAVERILGFVVDLSDVHAERAAASAALAQVSARDRFAATVFDTVQVGIIACDADGHVTVMNPVARRWHGLEHTLADADPRRLHRWACSHMYDPDTMQPLGAERTPFARVLAGESVSELDVALVAPGVPRRLVRCDAVALRDEHGDTTGVVLAMTDMTSERTARTAANLEQRRLAEAQRVGRLGHFDVDLLDRQWILSRQLYELWGHPDASPSQAELLKQVDDRDRVGLTSAFDNAIANGAGRYQHSFRIHRADTGEQRWLTATIEVQTDRAGHVARASGTHHDVTEQVVAEKEASEARTFLASVLAATPDTLVISDADTAQPQFLAGAPHPLGYTPEELLALPDPYGLLHAEDRQPVQHARTAIRELPDGDVATIRYRAIHRDGSWCWIAERVTPFDRDGAGSIQRTLSLTRDITDVVTAEEHLRHAATHDSLTGLLNRAELAARLQRALATATEVGQDVAVLYLDLDDFKNINDTHGHRVGDEVLAVIGNRLRNTVRPADEVARVGGDEFVILLEDPSRYRGDAEPQDEHDTVWTDVVERITGVVNAPILIGGRQHQISASVGLRIVPPDAGTTVEQILHDADATMYRAKKVAKSNIIPLERHDHTHHPTQR